MKQNSAFPETVEHKSCTATIYHQQHRRGERFEVRYFDVDGSRQRLTFPTCSSAKKFAETAVREIAANREHFITLRGRAAFDYQSATETLSPLGLSIAQGATLIAENHRQLGGRGTLPEAIKSQMKLLKVAESGAYLLEVNEENRNIEVIWGMPTENALKAKVYIALLAESENAKIRKIDLSAPHAPIVK